VSEARFLSVTRSWWAVHFSCGIHLPLADTLLHAGRLFSYASCCCCCCHCTAGDAPVQRVVQFTNQPFDFASQSTRCSNKQWWLTTCHTAAIHTCRRYASVYTADNAKSATDVLLTTVTRHHVGRHSIRALGLSIINEKQCEHCSGVRPWAQRCSRSYNDKMVHRTPCLSPKRFL